MIRFEDKDLNQLVLKQCPVSGQSTNWTGRFSDSSSISRRETVTAPANATHFWVVVSSSGPPNAVGVYGVKNLRFWRAGAEDKVQRLIPDWDTESADEPDPSRYPLNGWARSGLRKEDAHVVQFGPKHETAVVVVDNSPIAHVEWDTPPRPPDPETPHIFQVKPGERLTFAWDEFYSIGLAGPGSVAYKNLPAGLYRFRMEGLSAMGVHTGVEASVSVEVPVVFWKTGWFWTGALVGLGGLGMGVWRLSEWRETKRQLADMEKNRALQQERLRIAQDIHDDLGARVTQISLLSSAAQQKPQFSAEAQAEFAKVSQMSRNLVDSLHETVWAVSPENDCLESLLSYICKVANQMCAQAALKCRLQIPDLPDDPPVTSGIRHNLVMVVKEAIHNVIKHAEAGEVRIQIGLEAGRLTIEVADNGKGIDPATKMRGNGHLNMRRRMESIGGRWSQTSKPGAGTRICLESPLSEAKPSASQSNSKT